MRGQRCYFIHEMRIQGDSVTPYSHWRCIFDSETLEVDALETQDSREGATVARDADTRDCAKTSVNG